MLLFFSVFLGSLLSLFFIVYAQSRIYRKYCDVIVVKYFISFFVNLFTFGDHSLGRGIVQGLVLVYNFSIFSALTLDLSEVAKIKRILTF